jgi:hypothetical protein
MPKGSWAYIQFMDRPGGGGRPDQGLPGGGWDGDPGYGVDEGGHPDQGLPGFPGSPGHPGHLPARPGRPGGGGRPGHLPARPGRPVDPGYGVDEGGEAGQLPVWPATPDHPIHLPPIAGHPLPPIDPPPGTIWPPLPPDAAPTGKALVLAAIQGVGYRYIVIEIAPPSPDQGLPDGGEHPDQGLPPGQPGAPDQGLPQPPTAQPKSRLGR